MTRRRNPYPILVAVALVPALVLAGCWRLAVSNERAGAPVRPADDTGVVSAQLATPLLSVRRTPAVLARDVNIADFRARAQAFMSTLDSTQCAAISIDGQPVAGVHETTVLRPASNVKLLTAAVALEVLGPHYTFTTTVEGSLQHGVIDGNLYLIGGGDPLLTSAWWKGAHPLLAPFNVTSIEQFAARIKAAGVTSITGGVVGDASRFDDEWYPPSWTKDLRFAEGGPISALLVNDSREAPTV